MENYTSCDEYFESLKTSWLEQNMSMKYMPHPGGGVFWNTPDTAGYVKIAAYVVIIVGGLLGNLSVILTVALIKSMWNTINIYIVNLAVADAMICIICMLPHALTVYTEDKFILGEFMCKFNPFTQMTCLTCSVLTLCAISCDRYMAVFYPFESRTTEKRTSLILVVIWIVSMCVSIPFLIVKKHIVLEWSDFADPYCSEEWPIVFYHDESTDKCVKKQYLRRMYYVIFSITLFFVPILIMLTAYIMILFRLWTSGTIGEENEASNQALSRRKIRVLKMVFIVLIVFILCWMPLQVIVFISAFQFESSNSKLIPDWYSDFKWSSYYIAYANSFLNPFIYGQYNKSYRDGFCLILHCGHRNNRSGSCGGNIVVKSIRSMSTTLSSLRRTSLAFIPRRKSNIPPYEAEMQPTPTFV